MAKSVAELEKELELYKRDGIVYLYYSLNKKLNEMAEAIDEAEVSFNAKDDKSFDRLMKAMVESRSIAENLKWLRTEFKLTGDEDKDKKGSAPLIEMLAKDNM